MSEPKFNAQQVIDAIPGTGAVVSALARKLGIKWDTANNYIARYPTVAEAWKAERESMLDMAESVLLKNIQLAAKVQAGGEAADTSDAKWMLARMGKHRGWGDSVELEHSGEVTLKGYTTKANPDDWPDDSAGKP